MMTSNRRLLITEVGIGAWNTEPKTFKRFLGLWDTGAEMTAISHRVVETCALESIGTAEMNDMRGAETRDVFRIVFELPGIAKIQLPHVTKCNPPHSFTDGRRVDVLIGMDVISLGDFRVTKDPTGRLVCTLQLPNPAGDSR